MLTRRKSYGDADTREEAMAAFRAEYERRQRGNVIATDPQKVLRDAVVEAKRMLAQRVGRAANGP